MPTFIEDYKTGLESLCSSLGRESKRRLPLLKEKKIVIEYLKKLGRVLVFEDDNHVEHRVEPMSVVAATDDIEKRLFDYQKNFVEALLANFDKQIQMARVAILLRAIFDFRRMPLQDTPDGYT